LAPPDRTLVAKRSLPCIRYFVQATPLGTDINLNELSGTTVSHYRNLDKLGSGMGVVHRAEDERLGPQVAIKFLPENVSRDRQAMERRRFEDAVEYLLAGELRRKGLNVDCGLESCEPRLRLQPQAAEQRLESRVLPGRIELRHPQP